MLQQRHAPVPVSCVLSSPLSCSRGPSATNRRLNLVTTDKLCDVFLLIQYVISRQIRFMSLFKPVWDFVKMWIYYLYTTLNADLMGK